MSDRDKNIYFARLAEQGERYEDMIRYMKEVVKVSPAKTMPQSAIQISSIFIELLLNCIWICVGRPTFK